MSAEARSMTVLQLRDLLWKAGRSHIWLFQTPCSWRRPRLASRPEECQHRRKLGMGSRVPSRSVSRAPLPVREMPPDQLKLRLSQVKVQPALAEPERCRFVVLCPPELSTAGAVSGDDQPHPGGAMHWQNVRPSPCDLKDVPEDAK